MLEALLEGLVSFIGFCLEGLGEMLADLLLSLPWRERKDRDEPPEDGAP